MLLRVTSPSFGNTFFDATIPLSVTFILMQCEVLTFEPAGGSIRLDFIR
jgi:hypothetical protein